MPQLPHYRETLAPRQLAEGMNRALANARRLAEDSATLLKMDRIPSAVTFAILSIEESGKVTILRQMALADEPKEFHALWKAYRSHTKKNVMWILGALVAKGGRTLEDFRAAVDPGAEHPDALDHLKQLSIYTDCFRKAKWSSPEEVDLRELAPYLVTMADVLAKSRQITPEEVELWRHHLWPVKHASLHAQKQAVQAWYYDMKLRGLSEVSIGEVEAFLGTQPGRAQA